MKTLTTDQVDTIINIAFDTNTDAMGYSGRAMFGERCLAVAGSERDIARFLIALAIDDSELAEEVVKGYRTDSLGLRTVAYFTTVAASGLDDEDDDEDEEV